MADYYDLEDNIIYKRLAPSLQKLIDSKGFISHITGNSKITLSNDLEGEVLLPYKTNVNLKCTGRRADKTYNFPHQAGKGNLFQDNEISIVIDIPGSVNIQHGYPVYIEGTVLVEAKHVDWMNGSVRVAIKNEKWFNGTVTVS